MRGAPLFEETLQQLWDGLGLQALKLLLAPFGVTASFIFLNKISN